MPPTASTEATPLPPSATAAGAEATNNALAAARAAVLNAAGTNGETSPQQPSETGISPEGSGQIIGTTFSPGHESAQIGTGLSSKVEDETLIPASTAFTEENSKGDTSKINANNAINSSPTESPASEPQTVEAPVSPLDVSPTAEQASHIPDAPVQLPVTVMGTGEKININNPGPPLPPYIAPPSKYEPTTGAEALAATPAPTTAETFPNISPETVDDYNDLDHAYLELKSAKTQAERFKALAAIQTLATIKAIKEHDQTAA